MGKNRHQKLQLIKKRHIQNKSNKLFTLPHELVLMIYSFLTVSDMTDMHTCRLTEKMSHQYSSYILQRRLSELTAKMKDLQVKMSEFSGRPAIF